LIVKTTYANIYLEPTFKSELISQALMWDKLNVIESLDNWYRIKQWDGYVGWINKFYIAKLNKKNDCYIIPLNSINVYDSIKKRKIIANLLFGSYVPLKSSSKKFYELLMPNGKTGFVVKYADYNDEKNIREKIIEKSMLFLGVPYLWGGNSAYGFDCSGFVQSIFKYFGFELERDTSLQIKNSYLKVIKPSKAKVGDLVYFFINNVINHVGILIDDSKIIHASGNVMIENIQDVLDRLKLNKDSKIDFEIYSVKKLIKRRVNYER
tara:strand:+ start:53 stop:850 length:798 start_codon:yes stop_codon:yes gene_type:complete